MFQDPTFWVLISFIAFVALVFKKGKAAMNAEIQTYQESIALRTATTEQELNIARDAYEAQQVQYHHIMDQINEIQAHAKQEVAHIKKRYKERATQLGTSQVGAIAQRKAYIMARADVEITQELLDKTLIRVTSMLGSKHLPSTSIETLQHLLR